MSDAAPAEQREKRVALEEDDEFDEFETEDIL